MNDEETKPKEPRTFEYPFHQPPPLVDSPLPAGLRVTHEGHVIFDEASLGMLDEHIRKIVREEFVRMKIQLRMSGMIRPPV